MHVSHTPSRPLLPAHPRTDHAPQRRAATVLDTPVPALGEWLPPRERALLGGPWQESSFDLLHGLDVSELTLWPTEWPSSAATPRPAA
jgi:hypothetical protein